MPAAARGIGGADAWWRAVPPLAVELDGGVDRPLARPLDELPLVTLLALNLLLRRDDARAQPLLLVDRDALEALHILLAVDHPQPRALLVQQG